MNVKFIELTECLSEVRDEETDLLYGIMYRKSKMHEYSPVIADIICERMANGEKITRICKDKNMPGYGTIQQWLRTHEDFKKQYEESKVDRADFYFDKAVEEAELADEDTIATSKFRADTYKWAAQVRKPSEYGNKTTVKGDLGSITLKVDTGIVRPEDNILDTPRVVEEISGTENNVSDDIRESDNDSGDS